jgi:hypothetical protein
MEGRGGNDGELHYRLSSRNSGHAVVLISSWPKRSQFLAAEPLDGVGRLARRHPLVSVLPADVCLSRTVPCIHCRFCVSYNRVFNSSIHSGLSDILKCLEQFTIRHFCLLHKRVLNSSTHSLLSDVQKCHEQFVHKRVLNSSTHSLLSDVQKCHEQFVIRHLAVT